LPAALAEARAQGIDTGPIVEWAERILDTGGMLMVPKSEIEELRRAAKMPKPAKQNAEADKRVVFRASQARALAAAPKLPKFRRGLYDVAQLAQILSGLGYAHDSAEWEADIEGDESEVPAMLGEALKMLGAALVAMTAEEVSELLAAHLEDDEEMPEGVEERSLPPAERAFIAAAKTPAVRAWRRGIALARAGKSLSASNEDKLEAASGHQDRAMKHHRAIGEHAEAIGGQIGSQRSVHEKASGAHEDLGDHLQAAADAAKDKPEETGDHLKRAMSCHRSVSGHLETMGETNRNMDDRHQDLGDSHRAMGRSVKAAQRCVRGVIDGATPADDDEEAEDGKGAKAGNGADEEKDRRARLARAHKLRQEPPAA
jgi:hypothetical protein